MDVTDARNVLRDAIERNYHWPADVRGFSARVIVNDNETEWQGDVYAPSSQAIRVALPGAPQHTVQWATTEVRSIIGHRLYRTFEQGDGRYEVSFGEGESHPAGRAIRIHGDPRQSRYRVKDGLLREAYRYLGERHFILSVQSVQHLDRQQTVAQHYSVIHFTTATDELLRADVYRDEYARVDGVWLPRTRFVVSASDGGITQRSMAFEYLSVVYEGETMKPEVQPEDHEKLRIKHRL